MEQPSSRADWQDIFDKATAKANQLRPGVLYIRASQGNDTLQNALSYEEARALEAAHQLDCLNRLGI